MLLILLLTIWLNISDSQEKKVKYFKNQAVLGPLLGLPLEAMILFLQSKAPGEECQLCREAAKNVFTSWSPDLQVRRRHPC